MNYIKYFLLSICSLSIGCTVGVDSALKKDNDFNELSKYLVGTLTAQDMEGYLEVRYCPDNTCEIFRAPKSNSDDLYNFVNLYLYYSSGYVYLLMPTENNVHFLIYVRPRVNEIVKQYQGICSGSELEMASCILNNMSTNSEIKVFSLRYDEKTKIESKVDLSKDLNITNLQAIQSWRESHTKEK